MKEFREHQIETMPRINIRITHSKKRLRKWCESIGADYEPIEKKMETADAIANSFINHDGRLLFIVWMHDTTDDSAAQDAALLAHEAVHVAQAYFDYMGEDKPGDEQYAYVVQHATHYLVQEHFDWKQRQFDKKGC